MALHITPAERTALELLAAETTMHELARVLGVAEGDVEARLAALFSRFGVASRTDAIAAARRRGLLAITL